MTDTVRSKDLEGLVRSNLDLAELGFDQIIRIRGRIKDLQLEAGAVPIERYVALQRGWVILGSASSDQEAPRLETLVIYRELHQGLMGHIESDDSGELRIVIPLKTLNLCRLAPAK